MEIEGKHGGERVVSDHKILEDAGVGFDPTTQHLDLSKEEKRRTTALLMAIQAYDKLIIKDAEYLKEMHNESRRDGGLTINPATMDGMVEAAIRFDQFIAGNLTDGNDHPLLGGAKTQAL